MTTIRTSPSGPAIDGEEQADGLRYGVLTDTTTSGIVTSWVPVAGTESFDANTVGVRTSPPAALVVRGMPLAPGQQIVIRLGRTAAFPLVLLHEDTGAAAVTERFNNPNNANIMLRRGEGVLIRNTEGRNNVQLLSEDPTRILSKSTGTSSVTAQTTELSVGGLITFPPLFLQQHMIFQFKGYFEFVHTAAATPVIDVGFSVNGGAASFSSITPAANAGTFQAMVDCFCRLTASGSSGQWRANLQWKAPFGSGVNDQLGGGGALQSVDTTVSNTLELKMRMQTGVASNTLTIYNAYALQLG